MAVHASRVDNNAVSDLQEQFRGTLLRPNDDGYDEARTIWNAMIDRTPAVIAQCEGVADVIVAVNFGRDYDLPLAIRGEGHNAAGNAVCDGGLVIDLSPMASIRVDPTAQTVRVGPGATLGDLDHETQAFGLATPGGVVSDTGIAGLTLGGGIGHLRCEYGLSCDNLRSIDLVTADGEFLTASPEENAELFWGLRGGGGNFGIVTGFEFDLHPVGPEVATSLVFYSGSRLAEVLRDYREFVVEAPDEISTLVFAGELPMEKLFTGETIHEQKFAIMGCYAGPVTEGEAALEPLREFAEPLADVSGTMPYAEFQQLLDEDYPNGMRYYWKSLFLDCLSDSAIDRIDYWADAAPSPVSTVDVWQLGGAITDVGTDESAFAGRYAPFLLGVEANWENPENDDANLEWARDCLDDMRQFSDGSVYLNFPGFHEEGNEMMRTTFGPTYERLVALKDAYDPSNLFSRNQNIIPSGSAQTDGGAGHE